MRVIIQTPRITVPQSLIDFTHEKVGQLAEVSNDLLEARVTLKFDNADASATKACQIVGVVRGNDLFAEKKAETYNEAVLKAVDAIKRQLVDRKEERNRRDGAAAQLSE